MNIYVGNLSFQLSEDDLNSAFGEYGQVDSAKIITDRETGDQKALALLKCQIKKKLKKLLKD